MLNTARHRINYTTGVIAAAKAGMAVIAVPNAYTNKHDFSLAMKTASFREIDLNY